ncbi:hypothetical protein [Parasediminibacterium sp. JCM 36343]|uniref:hypothetical protein n=1 Tax=Parasediminibacterium sp. JCM 36343 TaxID=3374279 RepID=UPI00397E6D3F
MINGVYPTHGIFHETIEITHGITQNFEIGFYLFNALATDGRSGYVGSHIRPRISAPDKWKLPFGLSLSGEVGYQKLQYSEDDWTLEIRPIIDKTIGKFYFSLNPTIDNSLRGMNKNEGFVFSPNIKTSYTINKLVAAGLEYYGSLGPFNRFSPWKEQDEQLFIAADFDISPVWELNMGYGFGLNNSTNASILKLILGKRIDWQEKKSKQSNPKTESTRFF